jgi:hypothetical protein
MNNNRGTFRRTKRSSKKAGREGADRIFFVVMGLFFLAPVLVLALTLFGG